jgi:hypothetical protein
VLVRVLQALVQAGGVMESYEAPHPPYAPDDASAQWFRSGYALGFTAASRVRGTATIPDELRELSEAATAGEWTWRPFCRGSADAEFAAAAVNFVRSALAAAPPATSPAISLAFDGDNPDHQCDASCDPEVCAPATSPEPDGERCAHPGCEHTAIYGPCCNGHKRLSAYYAARPAPEAPATADRAEPDDPEGDPIDWDDPWHAGTPPAPGGSGQRGGT